MIPRQRRIQRNVFHPHFRVDIQIVEHTAPGVDIDLVRPGIEAAAAFVGQLQRPAQPTVATRENRFQPGMIDLMPFEPQPLMRPDQAEKIFLFLSQRLQILQSQPLKRSVRLGNMRGHANGDLRLFAVLFFGEFQYFYSQIHNGL